MDALADAASKLGLTLDAEAVRRFSLFRDQLIATNRQFNLTAITDPDDIETRLFAESLAILPLLPAGTERLLDVGSGGGIPGIPLAIARPDVRVDMLEATAKKVRFLHEATGELGLTNTGAYHGRAEDFGRLPAYREQYQAVTARAVARLVTLAELVLPFLAIGGVAILPKGDAAGDELREAREAIEICGGEPRPIFHSDINNARFVIIDKRRATPDLYPRRPGVPGKQPIGVLSR